MRTYPTKTKQEQVKKPNIGSLTKTKQEQVKKPNIGSLTCLII